MEAMKAVVLPAAHDVHGMSSFGKAFDRRQQIGADRPGFANPAGEIRQLLGAGRRFADPRTRANVSYEALIARTAVGRKLQRPWTRQLVPSRPTAASNLAVWRRPLS